jgi:hypothetical protein
MQSVRSQPTKTGKRGAACDGIIGEGRHTTGSISPRPDCEARAWHTNHIQRDESVGARGSLGQGGGSRGSAIHHTWCVFAPRVKPVQTARGTRCGWSLRGGTTGHPGLATAAVAAEGKRKRRCPELARCVPEVGIVKHAHAPPHGRAFSSRR